MDVDIIIKYAQKYSPVITGLEDRIRVVSSRDSTTSPEAKSPLSAVSDLLSKIPSIEIPSPASVTGDTAAAQTAAPAEDSSSVGATEAPTQQPAEDPKTPASPLSNVMDSLSSASDRFSAGIQGVGDRVSAGVQGIGERIQGAGDKLKKIPERFPVFGKIRN